jgi:hypothetical protein
MKIYKSAKKLLFPIIAVGILFFSSCYPDSATKVSELDTVVSFYDETINFDDYQTYFLLDTIVLLDSFSNQPSEGKFDDEILALIRNNLEELGYVEEPDPENNAPDVLILAAKTINERWVAYGCYDWWYYWGWYPGWGPYPPYGPGWCPGYPWGGPAGYTFLTGSLFIEMLDVEASDEDSKRIPVIWAGAMNGILEGSDASIEARINNSVNQLFDQSPYLKTN